MALVFRPGGKKKPQGRLDTFLPTQASSSPLRPRSPQRCRAHHTIPSAALPTPPGRAFLSPLLVGGCKMPSPGLSLAKARAHSTFLLCGGGGWVDGCGGQRKASDVTNTGAMRSYLLRQIWVWPCGLPGRSTDPPAVFYACAVHPWGRSWGQGEHDCQWRSTKAGNNLYKSFLPFHRVGSGAGTEATSLAASIPKPSSPRAANHTHSLPAPPSLTLATFSSIILPSKMVACVI